MQIHNRFHVPREPRTAWEILLDIPRIAPCMPGARLLGQPESDTYDGEVQVRLGPVMLAFRGRAEIVERDDAARRAKVRAKGRDSKGRGGASADIAFALVEDGEGTEVRIDTDLTLSGSIAQYGRASGMIEDLAGRLVAQFADNLRAELAEGPDGAGAVAPAQASPGAPAPAGEAEAGARPAAVAAAAEGPSAIQAAPEPARPALSGEEAAPRAAPPSGGREAAPISGLRLTLWLVWRQVLRLFSGRR